MAKKYTSSTKAVITNQYVRRSIKNVSDDMRDKIENDLAKVFAEATKELKKVSPRDNTTREDRLLAYKNGEVLPFIMHGERSADAYDYTIYESKTRKTVTGKILNDYAYITYLDKGLMNRTGLLINARVKERNSTGRYSEQRPKGGFIARTLKRVFKKYGYHIDKSKFDTRLKDYKN